jgi:hypothetical protein
VQRASWSLPERHPCDGRQGRHGRDAPGVREFGADGVPARERRILGELLSRESQADDTAPMVGEGHVFDRDRPVSGVDGRAGADDQVEVVAETEKDADASDGPVPDVSDLVTLETFLVARRRELPSPGCRCHSPSVSGGPPGDDPSTGRSGRRREAATEPRLRPRTVLRLADWPIRMPGRC